LNSAVKNTDLEGKIFVARGQNFLSLALEVFAYQYAHNTVYRQYCDLLGRRPGEVSHLLQLPFLPISFFKSHRIQTTSFEPETVFESSGTTQHAVSRHEVKDTALYEQSFTAAFEKQYGPARNWCILGLLPNYLERGQSSLVWMVNSLIARSGHPLGGFYLHDVDRLHKTLLHNEILQQPTLLIGVTYALLDFAAAYPMQLQHTTLMETGGMKGRRTELTRAEVHQQLQQALGVAQVHSEYGMTELLSQAYASADGLFACPPWMKVVLRSEDDPFDLTAAVHTGQKPATGAINIIDLANLYSCSFIATDDSGRLHADGRFEVLGRLDNSDIRGCSLMAI
jgi:hypothetical protein